MKSFVKEVFELTCIEDLSLVKGPAQSEANLQGASLDRQRLPEFQNVSLTARC